MTKRFLKKRINKKNLKKEVDRKASKNRKIRYIVHEKIVSFMVPLDLKQIEGRDAIVNSLFGKEIQSEEKKTLGIKRKGEDVRLI